MEAPEQSIIRPKTFTYKTHLAWSEGKAGSLFADGKPTIRFTSPPEFNGKPGNWTPEELFVASVETCHIMTFLSFAARVNSLISYESHTNGVLELVDGQYRFTRIVIFPTIMVSKGQGRDV